MQEKNQNYLSHYTSLVTIMLFIITKDEEQKEDYLFSIFNRKSTVIVRKIHWHAMKNISCGIDNI